MLKNGWILRKTSNLSKQNQFQFWFCYCKFVETICKAPKYLLALLAGIYSDEEDTILEIKGVSRGVAKKKKKRKKKGGRLPDSRETHRIRKNLGHQ